MGLGFLGFRVPGRGRLHDRDHDCRVDIDWGIVVGSGLVFAKKAVGNFASVY